MFLVYILQSDKSDRFYIGQTRDITKRILKHNNAGVTATSDKGPWKLVYKEPYLTRSEAVKR